MAEETAPPEAVSEAPAEEAAAPAGDVDCTFVIMPENFKHTAMLAVASSGAEIKQALAKELPLPVDAMSLKNKGVSVSDEQTLAELGYKGGDKAELELVVEYRQQAPAKANVVPGQLPASIDVELSGGPDGQPRMVTVNIDTSQAKKLAFLGGYRNKKTGVEYLHACCQTDKKPVEYRKDAKFTRETQTYVVKTRSLQTQREASTQMARPDLLLDDSRDVEVDAGAYMTSEEFHQLKIRMTIVIQRYTRGWKARCRGAELRRQKLERQRFLEEEEEKARVQAEIRRRREIERRMRPRTTEDFEILYNELEAWRLQETAKIHDADLPPEVKQATLKQLLHKETKLLQTIDRLKISANHENRDVRIARTLADMSAPKRWEIADGSLVEVHTPFTTRAKELMQLYNGLRLPLLTTDERLDVLLHVKWTVKEFDCNLTREVVELIDREADLLNRGRDPKSMEGLRRRIANLFLHFIETPEFNPEAGRYTIASDQMTDAPSQTMAAA